MAYKINWQPGSRIVLYTRDVLAILDQAGGSAGLSHQK
jgi:hypothetical protein